MNNDFWGFVALGWFTLIAILLGYLIFLMTGIYAMTPIPDTYRECIASDLPDHICEILYPPLNRQGV